jgi:hypothetical protein
LSSVTKSPQLQNLPAGFSGSSALMRKVKMLFLVLSLLSVLVVHLPVLPLVVQGAGHAFGNLLGQEHRWTMFSADPRGISVDMWATVSAGNDQTIWSIDRTGLDFGFYHWVKWMEVAVLEPQRVNLDGLAAWLAKRADESSAHVTVYGITQPARAPDQPHPEQEIVILYEGEPTR